MNIRTVSKRSTVTDKTKPSSSLFVSSAAVIGVESGCDGEEKS